MKERSECQRPHCLFYLRANELLLERYYVGTIVDAERSPEFWRFPVQLEFRKDADRVPPVCLDPVLQLQGPVGVRIRLAVLQHRLFNITCLMFLMAFETL